MLNPNEIEGYNNSLSAEKNNDISFEYIIPFPQELADNIDKFIERFQISYDILVNKLLSYHFHDLKSEFESEDYLLLTYYYFCVDEIFNNAEKKNCYSLNEAELKTKSIPIKVNQKFHSIIKEISKEIHYKPEIFIKKAVECQWNEISNNLEAGYYYIIKDFCNISRIKKILEEVFKKEDIKE